MKNSASGLFSKRTGAIWALRLFFVVWALACSPCSLASSTLRAIPTQELVAGEQIVWQPAFEGIELARMQVGQPRPMRLVAARIDLQAPGIRFLSTPARPAEPGVFDSMKTSTFLRKYGLQLAINASPYSPVVNSENEAVRVLGLSLSDGKLNRSPQKGSGALLITKDNRIRISDLPRLDGMHNGVGGFSILLRKGEVVDLTTAPLHPRTAAGVTRDGRFLLLLIIDGRQPGYSEGASTRETAEWLKRLGAWDALNLDGGGSTTIAVANGRDGVRVLNWPIHRGLPGNQRPVANHLGIYANPLP